MKGRKPPKPAAGRPGIIVTPDPLLFESCKIIAPNLVEAYRRVFGLDAHQFSFSSFMRPSEIWGLAREIAEARPDRLVFVSCLPHPGPLLQALARVYGTEPLPPLYVHVYGDFTLYTRHWLECEELLKKTRVLFICASPAQEGLISRFLLEPGGAVAGCPFPVDRTRYFSDPGARKKWRQKLGLGEGELGVVYSGRLSLQKNVGRLVSEFGEFARRNTGVRARLFFAGYFDDFGASSLGVELTFGAEFQHWLGRLKALREQEYKLVRFLWKLTPEELVGLYNAADLFLSLSLYEYEDYGMAPAEALCSGTPCVLSGWGGYAGFAIQGDAAGSEAVRLVPPRISNQGLSLSHSEIQSALQAQSRLDRSEDARRARSEAYLARFSIEAACERIRAVHRAPPPPFQGFHWLMRQHAEAAASGTVIFPEGPRIGTFYEQVYASYLGPGSSRHEKGYEGPSTHDWFAAQQDQREMQVGVPRPKEAQELLGSFGIETAEYVCSLRPIFLSAKMGLEALNAKPLWMARDGLVPLLWFFKAHPAPGKLRSRILVHEELAPFVPDAWRGRIGTYRIVSTSTAPEPQKRKFIVSGILAEPVVSSLYLKERLARLVEQVDRRVFAQAEILGYLPLWLTPADGGSGFYSECLFRIAETLGSHIRNISFHEMVANWWMPEYELIELNEGLLYADSTTALLLLARGVRRLGESPQPLKPGEEFVPIMHMHGAVVRLELGRGSPDRGAPPDPERITRAMLSAANLNYPWATWFKP